MDLNNQAFNNYVESKILNFMGTHPKNTHGIQAQTQPNQTHTWYLVWDWVLTLGTLIFGTQSSLYVVDQMLANFDLPILLEWTQMEISYTICTLSHDPLLTFYWP